MRFKYSDTLLTANQRDGHDENMAQEATGMSDTAE
jgi:hypothetical protein